MVVVVLQIMDGIFTNSLVGIKNSHVMVIWCYINTEFAFLIKYLWLYCSVKGQTQNVWGAIILVHVAFPLSKLFL